MSLSAVVLGTAAAILVLLALHRWLLPLLGVLLRTVAGLCVLQLLALLGHPMGILLGVNLFNALVLGVLGVPGFGLLLLLSWSV